MIDIIETDWKMNKETQASSSAALPAPGDTRPSVVVARRKNGLDLPVESAVIMYAVVKYLGRVYPHHQTPARYDSMRCTVRARAHCAVLVVESRHGGTFLPLATPTSLASHARRAAREQQ